MTDTPEQDTACRAINCDCPSYVEGKPELVIDGYPSCVRCHNTKNIHTEIKYGGNARR